jgi:hypothetical protein
MISISFFLLLYTLSPLSLFFWVEQVNQKPYQKGYTAGAERWRHPVPKAPASSSYRMAGQTQTKTPPDGKKEKSIF